MQSDNNFRILASQRYVTTRWLSLDKTIKRLFKIWNSLILCIQAKPKDLSTKETKYSEFLSILQDGFFLKIQIIGCSMNIIFQNQSVETDNIRTETKMESRSSYTNTSNVIWLYIITKIYPVFLI